MPLNKPPAQENEVIQNVNSKNYFTYYWQRWIQTLHRYIDQKVPEIYTDTTAPTSTPRKVGDMFVDTSANKVYVATGTSSSSDWTILN